MGCIHQGGGGALCFSPGEGAGRGKCTKVPTLSCCPQHPGESGIWAVLPFIAATSIEHPPHPHASTTGRQGREKAGGGGEGGEALLRDSTRIQ